MGTWQARILANSIKACIPFQAHLRKLKFSLVPPRPGHHHDLLVDGILEQIAMIRKNGGTIAGARVLEIGSGWIPVAPLIYRIAGAREVILSDQHRLLHSRSVEAAVALLKERRERFAQALSIDAAQVSQVLDVALDGDLDAMLRALGLTYLVPLDRTSLEGEIAVAYSHTVLEHIPPGVLEEIFALVRENLMVGGLFCNGIDHSDHRHVYDDSLSLVDFLRFSEPTWKLLCINPQDYTNRLRHSDYVELLEEAGFRLLDTRTHVSREALEVIDPTALPDRFRERSREDLCTTWSLVLAGA